ncbi:MAG TPA: lipid-binding SYLF domain-containing protein [Candidatus Angelobacter sp.]|nr:lipid-binding SYLF domain-containing protein [Candidatus Angelobacter sp.]
MKFTRILLLLAAVSVTLHAQKKEQDRLEHAGQVLQEIINIPDNLPKPVLDRSDCVIVLPSVKKGALGIGASIGRGAMSCRSGANFTGPWGPPAMYALEGISFGFQIGGQATDFVLLVMNNHGAEMLMKSKAKLGADASAAAGPVGRDAEAATDIAMHAEILTYSRAKGLFAGISLEGSTLRPDGSANNNLYGHDVSAKDIVRDHKVGTPAAARLMLSTLEKASPRNKTGTKK